jgi:hypothetical protein
VTELEVEPAIILGAGARNSNENECEMRSEGKQVDRLFCVRTLRDGLSTSGKDGARAGC